jgi:S1-C subfamily serine protease
LSNNQKYKATLVGQEPDKDLAVLKIVAPGRDKLLAWGTDLRSEVQSCFC